MSEELFDKLGQEAQVQAFSEMLDTPAGTQRVQEAGLSYIKRILREESFTRKVLPPMNITKFDTQRSTTTDTVEKIVDIEPNSTALPLSFRSEAPSDYVEGARYAIPFYTISSPLFEKTEQELYAYESPVIKIIEENSVKDIQEVEDKTFIDYSQIAVEAADNVLKVTGTTTLSSKKMLTESFKLLDENRLQTSVILMNNVTFNDVLGLPSEQIGNNLNSEIVQNGYSYNQLLGKKLIVTTKSNIVKTGQVWFFADQKYLGNFFILNNTKFWIQKQADLIRFKTWEVVGMGIGNIYGIAKLEFGSGIETASGNGRTVDITDL